MKVNIEDIDENGLRLDIIEDISEFYDIFSGTGIISMSPVNARFDIEKSGSDIFIKGSLDADAKMRCSRCLVEFDGHIHSDIDLVFLKDVQKEATEGHEKELSKEDLDINYYADEELDLAEILREQIALDLPAKPLCRPDCKGLCPRCGTDLNKGKCGCFEEKHIDARLKKLKEFKSKNRL